MSALTEYLPTEAATTWLAERIAKALPTDTSSWLILLEGELGAGKSTFARGLIRALGFSGAVPSPTYTLVEPYELPGRAIYHIDLYRLSDAEELPYLGFDELDQGLRLIEWPDRAPQIAGQADIRIRLSYENSGRCATVLGLSPRGSGVVKRIVVAA